jgi:hypothetical protein
MAKLEILGSGRLDDRDSAFPQAVQLSGGTILCSFSVGGGPNAEGHTEVARSTDGGQTWSPHGTILESTERPRTTNCLRISKAPDSDTLYAYGSRSTRPAGGRFGEGHNEPVFCRSDDGGASWSAPSVVPMPAQCALEISFAAFPLRSGRLLAPAATLPDPARLGEKVIVAVSDDGGRTWPRHAVVFRDPQARHGYFEHKFAEQEDGTVLAVCWTVTLGDTADRPNHFARSADAGLSWSPARSTGIMGQTMTPVPIEGNRMLVLYNRRYGEQGVVMAVADTESSPWRVLFEDLLYDAKSSRARPREIESGVDEFDAFEFGFPTAIRLQDGTFLATHWCKEAGTFGIRWTRLKVVDQP